MQILVVDDEALARSRLIRLIEDIPDCAVCGEAHDGDDALAKVQSLDPDLVLLDVRMPGKDGIAVAKALELIEDPPAVVFCTAFDDYALQAFDTLAQGYIVKPVQLEQLKQVIEKTKKLTKVQSKALKLNAAPVPIRRHITAKTRKGIELIAIDDILCFIADQKYVTVIHRGGETLIDDTLKELEDTLATGFLRVHRNALVAVDKIEGLERGANGQYSVKLKHTSHCPNVSRRHLAHAKETLECL